MNEKNKQSLVKSGKDDWLNSLREASSNFINKSNNKFTGIMDIIFAFDTTGSMYFYLEQVQTELTEIILEINGTIPNSLLGIIAYGDYCDKDSTYITKVLNLSNDVNKIKSFVKQIEKTGGGDEPEALEVALYNSATMMQWRTISKKAMVIVGDAPPHGVIDKLIQYNYQTETQKLKNLGVKIYAVQCGKDKTTEQTFRWIAKITDGIYLNLNNIKDLKEALIGSIMKEAGAEKLDNYITKVIQKKSLTATKQEIFKQLKGN